jgi:hypothetical protein
VKFVKAVERGSMLASFNDILSAKEFWNELEANKIHIEVLS